MSFRNDSCLYRRDGSPRGDEFGGGALTLAQQFAALFVAGDSWFDADLVAVDGGTGKLQSFIDRIDNTHLLTQTALANQCALPAADATMGGAKTAMFTVAGTTKYVGNRALSQYQFLHDLSGSETVLVATPQTTGATGVWLTTRSSAIGFTMYRGSGGQHGFFVNAGGTAGSISTGTALTAGTATYLDDSSIAGASSVLARLKSAPQASATATTAAASDPQQALTLGTDTTNYAAMNFRAVYMFRRVLSAAERATVQAYIQADTGIAP